MSETVGNQRDGSPPVSECFWAVLEKITVENPPGVLCGLPGPSRKPREARTDLRWFLKLSWNPLFERRSQALPEAKQGRMSVDIDPNSKKMFVSRSWVNLRGWLRLLVDKNMDIHRISVFGPQIHCLGAAPRHSQRQNRAVYRWISTQPRKKCWFHVHD